MDKIIIDGLAFALPLFIIAIAGIYCERSGITNLALEGFQGFGAFFGAAAISILQSLNLNFINEWHFYIAMIFAIIGGVLISMLHALLCIKYRANQVISGVVMNILSISLTAFLTRQINQSFFGAASNKFQLNALNKITIPIISKIPIIGAVFKDLYPFEFIIIIIAIGAWVLLYKTKYGLHLRACGDNPQAVDSAGINVKFVRYSAVLISGALAAIGGICYAYSISANFSPANFMGFGFLSIAALIFGNWEILPTLGATLLFGFARSGGYQLAKVLNMDSAFTDITMTLPYIFTLILLVFFSKSNKAPRALGKIYDKGQR